MSAFWREQLSRTFYDMIIHMHYVYILQSINHPREIYIGSTSKDPEVRLKEHNYGSTQYTADMKPWRIVYYEAYLNSRDAHRRERKLKDYGNSLTHLKKRISESLVS